MSTHSVMVTSISVDLSQTDRHHSHQQYKSIREVICAPSYKHIQLVHHTVFIFMPQLLPVLTVPTQ